jgi:chromosomal replication initiator protein
MNINAQDIWGQVLAILQQRIDQQSYKTWFVPIRPLKIEGVALTIQIPNKFFYEWLEEHYVDTLRQILHNLLGAGAKLEYWIPKDMPKPQPVVGGSKYKNYGVSRDLEKHYGQNPVREMKNPFAIPGIQKIKVDTRLNSDYTFDTFIEGDCNRLARSAGLAIGQRPGSSAFNPLLLQSETGMGKTHLAHAIGNQIKANFPAKNVLFISAESFANQFVEAIKNNSVNEFVGFFAHLDALIVDDIQFLAGKTKTQDTFFGIFNALHQNGRQLIFTCDRPLRELQNIDERLMSRFKWGLAADLQMPTAETRLAIVQQKMERDGIEIPFEVAEYISLSVNSNVRELEGVLISLVAESALNQRVIDIHLAHELINKCVETISNNINVDFVQRLVADFYKLKPNDLVEKGRSKSVVIARHIAMYLSKTVCEMSFSEIGRSFGGRDHSTVMHACQSVKDSLEKDMIFKHSFEQIYSKIRNLMGK